MLQPNIISKNSTWQQRLNTLPRLAASEHPIIVHGDSGTGKDVLAREIHRLSRRSEKPYVSVNCAAIQESLVESELFGHRKGSFTGAEAGRIGAFQAAHEGTLFLDEIGDLPMSIQAKLLRAIENKEIKAVGSDQISQIDVRIISATHKNLPDLIQMGLFRQDLFYRLNVIQLDVPTLRERQEDIPALAANIAEQNHIGFSDQALEALAQYSWPGNIRELKNFILRASAIYPHQSLGPSEVFYLLRKNTATAEVRTINNRTFLRRVEQGMVLERLAANGWNQRRTARELGIPKSTLNDQLRRMGVGVRKDEPVNELSRSDLDTRSLPGLDSKPH